MNFSEILGYAGTALVIIAYAPQINHLIKEQCSAGISLRAYYLWSLASAFFLIHSLMIWDMVFIVVQIVNLILGGLVIFFTKKLHGQVCLSHSFNKNGN